MDPAAPFLALFVLTFHHPDHQRAVPELHDRRPQGPVRRGRRHRALRRVRDQLRHGPERLRLRRLDRPDAAVRHRAGPDHDHRVHDPGAPAGVGGAPPGPGFFRAVYFLPYGSRASSRRSLWVVPVRARPVADRVAAAVDGAAADFLGAGQRAVSIANIVTWTYTGYNMLIIVAQLKSIPARSTRQPRWTAPARSRSRGASDPAHRAGPGADDGVLDHRHAAALRRTTDPVDGRPGDRHRVHAELRRYTNAFAFNEYGVRECTGGDHRAGRLHPVVRVLALTNRPPKDERGPAQAGQA